jgi:hypothetical protein
MPIFLNTEARIQKEADFWRQEPPKPLTQKALNLNRPTAHASAFAESIEEASDGPSAADSEQPDGQTALTPGSGTALAAPALGVSMAREKSAVLLDDEWFYTADDMATDVDDVFTIEVIRRDREVGEPFVDGHGRFRLREWVIIGCKAIWPVASILWLGDRVVLQSRNSAWFSVRTVNFVAIWGSVSRTSKLAAGRLFEWTRAGCSCALMSHVARTGEGSCRFLRAENSRLYCFSRQWGQGAQVTPLSRVCRLGFG